MADKIIQSEDAELIKDIDGKKYWRVQFRTKRAYEVQKKLLWLASVGHANFEVVQTPDKYYFIYVRYGGQDDKPVSEGDSQEQRGEGILAGEPEHRGSSDAGSVGVERSSGDSPESIQP